MKSAAIRTADVSLTNWRLAPASKWAFQNVRQLIPTACISANPAATPLPQKKSTLHATTRFACAGNKSLASILAETHSDSMVVLHRACRIYQWQADHCDIEQPHIVFSISKSITAMLVGTLVNEQILDVTKPILHYLPGVRGSAYEDCSLQQLLDMQVALAFDESYLDATGDYRRYRDASGWNAVDQTRPGPTLESFLYSLKKSNASHGERFEYNSPNSDLLGLLAERVTKLPYAELLSCRIWQPMGAESDGYVTVDPAQLARGAGGICVTVNDLARFGQLVLDRGMANDGRVIPPDWIEDTSSQGSREAWQKGDFVNMFPAGGYRNQWYQAGDEDGTIVAIGIHGQWLYINPAAEIVIAKLSSQPEPLDDALDSLNLKVFAELCGKIKGVSVD